jgi:hypothetical protein
MFAKSTDARGIELGFESGGHFWLVGRAGVLGSCPEDVAASALACQTLERVRAAWRGVPDGMTHYEVALQYRDVLVGRGEQLFGGAGRSWVARKRCSPSVTGPRSGGRRPSSGSTSVGMTRRWSTCGRWRSGCWTCRGHMAYGGRLLPSQRTRCFYGVGAHRSHGSYQERRYGITLGAFLRGRSAKVRPSSSGVDQR